MKQSFLRAEFVTFIPEEIEDGVIYISERYHTATHRCCCGCGTEVVTPLGAADWTLKVNEGIVTLHPSIGNWSLPCRSHYFIRDGRVVWALDMSREEIALGRVRDRRLREAHMAEVNSMKAAGRHEIDSVRPEPWMAWLWRTVRTLFTR